MGIDRRYFFLPGSHEYQLILAVFLCVYTAALMINSVSYKLILLVNLTPLLLPLIANAFWHAKDVPWGKNFELGLGLGLILLVFYLVILRGYAVLHRANSEAITLRFKTNDLAESLSQQKAIAEQANMAKSRFLAAASHDLRQPLHAQNLFMGALRMQLQNSTQIETLDKLQMSMDILTSMLNALLDISRKDVLRIEVCDSGPGIPEEKQQMIFQEYYQLENPERDRNKGLGLGLSIVERLTRLLAYPIVLRSKPGKGSLFAMDVPLGDICRVTAVEVIEQGIVFDHPGNFLVMLIDDDLSIQIAMEELLRTWGCRVQLAESSDDAIRWIQSRERCQTRLSSITGCVRITQALRRWIVYVA